MPPHTRQFQHLDQHVFIRLCLAVLYRRYTRHSADVSAFWLWLCVFGCLVQTLHEAFSRCASVLSHSSQPDDVAVQVNHCHSVQIGYQSQRAGRNGWLRAVEARMRVVGGESSGWFSLTLDEKLRVKVGAKEFSSVLWHCCLGDRKPCGLYKPIPVVCKYSVLGTQPNCSNSREEEGWLSSNWKR